MKWLSPGLSDSIYPNGGIYPPSDLITYSPLSPVEVRKHIQINILFYIDFMWGWVVVVYRHY